MDRTFSAIFFADQGLKSPGPCRSVCMTAYTYSIPLWIYMAQTPPAPLGSIALSHLVITMCSRRADICTRSRAESGLRLDYGVSWVYVKEARVSSLRLRVAAHVLGRSYESYRTGMARLVSPVDFSIETRGGTYGRQQAEHT